MDTGNEDDRRTEDFKEYIAPEGSPGNYMYFRNETKVKLYFEIWNPKAWKGWADEINAGSTSTPYQPNYQDVMYEVHAWIANTDGKCCYSWPILVKHKPKQVIFKVMSDDTYHACVEDKK